MTSWIAAVAALPLPADYMWLRLGEPSGTNADDASVNNHDGTHSGSTVTVGEPGLLAVDTDKSAKYTGASPVTTVTGAAWMDATQFSIVFIFKTATLGASNAFIGRDTQALGRRFQVVIAQTTGLVSFNIINNTGGAYTSTTLINYDDGGAHLCVCTYDQTQVANLRQNLYVDNATTAVNGGANNINTTGTPSLSVGNLLRTAQSPGNSWIDEVLYIPGVVLTNADRLNLYAAMTAPGLGSQPPAPHPARRLLPILAR